MNNWHTDLGEVIEQAVESGLSKENFSAIAISMWDEFSGYAELRRSMVLSRNAKVELQDKPDV